MARNIEIKARVPDMAALTERVADLADDGPTQIYQFDTFFRCDTGRLKLRKFSDSHGELIFYRRADESGFDRIDIERVPSVGIGKAIADRLRRCARR